MSVFLHIPGVEILKSMLKLPYVELFVWLLFFFFFFFKVKGEIIALVLFLLFFLILCLLVVDFGIITF